MEEQIKKNDEVEEVNFQRLLDALLRRAWLIVLSSLVCAVAMIAITFFFITPLYKSSAMFYVNNSDISVGASLSIDSADISASKSLVNTYIVILQTRETLNDVIDYAEVHRTYSEIKDMIVAESVDETEVFRVVVTSPDPKEANKIANAIAYILPKRISSIVEGTSAKIVDSAVVASHPSSPSYTVNTLMGFLIGFVASAGWIVLQELFDITVRSEEDIAQVCKHPLLASVPNMTAPTKGGHYYGYGKGSKKKKKTGIYATGKSSVDQPVLIGGGISFAASEAYKLLRTKLQFSFADDNHCRVIGLSSALSGEGKSLSASNLAYTLAQLDKKIILIDCDMRRPTLAEKLGLQSKPGLSNFLTGQCGAEGLVQCYGKEGNTFHIITAGENPPNPIELLSSQRMAGVLKGLRESYDYIILDLPPVGEVSDALAVAKETDGILLVVRQDYCDRVSLSETVRQFDFINSRILGVIFNCTSEYGGKYGKNYYKRYYRGYYRHYRKYGRDYSKNAYSAEAKKK